MGAARRVPRAPLEVVNPTLDPTFRFMPKDHDGKIRMDCSSPYAMAGLLALKDRFDLAIGNDPDADRHGIVTPRGLMNPNHYLAAALHHLYTTRSWPGAKVGKTAVTSALLDRVAQALGREVYETPVGFKHFVAGLLEGWLGFAGEESAGASFLRFDGRPFSTDKDGILMGLLAAELMAKRGQAPDALYEALAEKLGRPYYARKDLPVSPEAKARLARLSAKEVHPSTLAGSPSSRSWTGPRATGSLWAGSRWWRPTPGSPCAQAAPRTWPRSTRKASSGKPTWKGSWRKPPPSSTRPSPEPRLSGP